MVHRSLLPAAAALLLLCVGCWAQDAAECSPKTAITDFNATLYLGKWYEYAKMGVVPYEEGGICVTAEYSMMSKDNITVVNTMKQNGTVQPNSTVGWAEFASDQHNEGKLKVHFPNSPAVGDYWVLSTDYDNYSIVWSCAKRPGGAQSAEISWILLRSADYSNMTLDKVQAELQNLQLAELSKYTKTEQSPKFCSGAEHVVGALLSVVLASLFALLH